MFIVETSRNAHASADAVPANEWSRLSAHRTHSAAFARIDRENIVDARRLGSGAWRCNRRVVRVTRTGREILDWSRENWRQILALKLGRSATEAEITAAIAA